MAQLPFCIPPKTDPISVENWSKGMRLQFTTKDELNRYAIEEVVWGKENDIIGHEFLVVRIITGHFLLIERSTRGENIKAIINSDDPVDTLFEGGCFIGPAAKRRTVEQEVKRELEDKFRSMNKQESRSLFASSSEISKEKKFIAVDLVSNVDRVNWCTLNPHRSREKALKGVRFKLYTYTFQRSDNPFTLRDIGVIANAVHQSEKAYSWKTRNCYFFASEMMRIIQEVANPAVRRHEGADWAGRAGPSYTLSFLPGERRFGSPNVGVLIQDVRKVIHEDNKKILRDSKQAFLAQRSTQLEAQLQQKSASEARLRQENEALNQRIAQMKHEMSSMSRAMRTRRTA